MLNCIISFIAVVALSFGLHLLFNLKSALTPLVSLALLINIVSLAGMFDLLKPGVFMAYSFALVILAAGIVKNRSRLKEKLDSFLSPGVMLFLLASVAMLAFLAIRQPLMTEWDEFSFWGISKHLVNIHNQLYTFYKSSMIGNSTPPTLAVLSYFFQWGTEFTEWIAFFGYDVMFFACYSAFTAAFDRKKWNSAFVVFLLGFLSPYIFEVYTKIIHLEPVYITTYADVPLGVVTAGALAVYFFSDDGDSRDILPLLPVLMFLTLIKDMGFALSCIVAFVAFFDMLVGRKEFSFLKIKGFFGKCFAAAAMLIVAAGSFLGWSAHMARVMQRNPFELGGETNMSQVQMLITGVKELLIGPQSDKFVYVKERMTDAFFTSKVSMLGSGAVIFALVSVLFVLAFIFGNKNGRKRSAMMYITTIIGFIGYYVFHLFLYVYIFKDNAYGLVSYNRYIYPYYIMWLMAAVFALCLAASEGKKFFAKGTLFGLTAVIFLIFSVYCSYDNLFIECNDRSFATRLDIKKRVAYIEDSIGEDDVIFLHCGGDNGERWFIYTHEFAANMIVEERAVDTEGLSEAEKIQKYQQTFYERFKQAGVTHLMIDKPSEAFALYFGDLFKNCGIWDIGANCMGYYKVNYENDWYNFELVKGGNIDG